MTLSLRSSAITSLFIYLDTITKHIYFVTHHRCCFDSPWTKSCHHLLIAYLPFLAATFTSILLKHFILRAINSQCDCRPRSQNSETPPPTSPSPKTQPLTCRLTSIFIPGFSSRQPINMEIKLLRILFGASPSLHSGNPALGSSPLLLIIPPGVFNCI